MDIKKRLEDILFSTNQRITEIVDIDFINEGLLDSLKIFELINSIEAEFGIVINVYDIIPENFKNINTILKLIEKNTGLTEKENGQ